MGGGGGGMKDLLTTLVGAGGAGGRRPYVLCLFFLLEAFLLRISEPTLVDSEPYSTSPIASEGGLGFDFLNSTFFLFLSIGPERLSLWLKAECTASLELITNLAFIILRAVSLDDTAIGFSMVVLSLFREVAFNFPLYSGARLPKARLSDPSPLRGSNMVPL